MVTRLYIDNFRCFVNFEHKPFSRELIIGRNGSGKSSLLDILLRLRQFAVKGDPLDGTFILAQRTRWLDQSQITAELEVELETGSRYLYRLVLEPYGEPPQPRVASESVHMDGKPLFEFTGGELQLYNDQFEHKVNYNLDWHRSALATIPPAKDTRLLDAFRMWFSKLLCFRLNPFNMAARAEGENLAPNVDLSNFAAWYRHLIQSDPRTNSRLIESLREALDDFTYLQMEPFAENVRLLVAEFGQHGGTTSRFFFNELSDGQRCLICLYTILHFVIAKGGTVVLDEPDNFISLREIQPWLMAVSDAIEENHGQVLMISHHPEIINQWAPSGGVQFIRDGNRPVRVERFTGDPESCLPPAELIARGWERE